MIKQPNPHRIQSHMRCGADFPAKRVQPQVTIHGNRTVAAALHKSVSILLIISLIAMGLYVPTAIAGASDENKKKTAIFGKIKDLAEGAKDEAVESAHKITEGVAAGVD